MVAVGAIVGAWLFRRELARAQLPESGVDAALWGVLGGMLGAKLLWVAEHHAEDSLFDLLLSRGGMSWFGGFAGGVLAGVWVLHRRRLPLLAAMSAATPGLAVGHAIGRLGCFLVGDDYGRPSTLPWAVAFPEGYPPTLVPVHPTQIYEAIGLVPLAWVLMRQRRRGRHDAAVVGWYLVWTATLRFAIEFLRVNVRVLGVLSVAHLASAAALIVGLGLIIWSRGSRQEAISRTSPH